MNYPTISANEFEERVKTLNSVMSENGVDLVVAFSNLLDPSSVRYYTDFAAVNESAAFIKVRDGESILCSGQASYDYAQVKNKLSSAKIMVFPEIGEVSGFEYDMAGQMDFLDCFNELKNKYTIKKVGLIGKLIFPAVIYNKIKAAFDGAEIIDFDLLHYEQRIIKSPAEIECLKTNWEMVSELFKDVVPRIEEGMTELQIQAMFEYKMLSLGAESYVQAFAPMVATGEKNSFISMYRNTMRKIKKSEILNLAAGVCYEGYNGITCTPYVLGEIPQKIKDAVMCAYDALNFASAKMKPGTPCDIVLNAYTDYLTKYGYIDYCPYGSLHSTGMLECEAPVFSTENKRIIKENMAICIDAYFKGMEWGSFRIEDCYLIKPQGAERMTTYNDKAIPEIFR